MPLLTDLVYEMELALNIAEAFSVASEFALAFSIRKMDREGLRIVLNVTTMPSRFLFLTWSKDHVIRVLFLDEHRSLVRILARRAVSPHHLLRFPFFLANRVEPQDLRHRLEQHFGRYETVARAAVYQEHFADSPGRRI